MLREIVHRLEKSGLVQPYENRGRRVSAAGQRLLDAMSKETLQALSVGRPELAKYRFED